MKKQIIAVGKTYPIKEELKAMGAKWDGNNWNFEEMPITEIEGIDFELKIKIDDTNEIQAAILEMYKIFKPRYNKTIEMLAKANRRTFEEQAASEETIAAMQSRFNTFCQENISTKDRAEFENYRAYKQYRDEFRKALQEEAESFLKK